MTVKDKDGKVIRYVCDKCKKDIKEHNNCTLKLLLATNGAITWDICPDCIDIFKQELGIGRSVLPYSEIVVKKGNT